MINRPTDTEAEHYLRRAIDLAPGNTVNYANLALLLEKQGHRDEAEHYHRLAVTQDAASLEFRLNLADYLANSHNDEDIAEAKAIYLDALLSMPTHPRTWSNLGALLFKTGYTSAAQTAYTAAIAYRPEDASLHVKLAKVLLYRDDLNTAEAHFLEALALDRTLFEAHQGLSCIYHRQNKEEKARFHRDEGFSNQPIVTVAWNGHNKPQTLLIVASALEGNIPWRLLIDQNRFHITMVTVEYLDRPEEFDLASYSLIFNAIGDADLCRSGLEIAQRLVASASSPIINAPAAVLPTGRLANAHRLSKVSGVRTSNMMQVSKRDIRSGHALEQLERIGLAFPLLLRAPGFHGGNHFVRVELQNAFRETAEQLPGKHLLAMEWLDSRNDDALFRKYRIMAIDGVLYPLHMAISTQWKVHYFSSDMEENSSYREEERAFLRDFTAVLGASAISGLERIAQTLGLDYCGIDFGLDKSGRVLLYEANATMAIVPPNHEQQWDYKRASIDNALAAVKNMFAKRIALQA